jgi:hypothetical protein
MSLHALLLQHCSLLLVLVLVMLAFAIQPSSATYGALPLCISAPTCICLSKAEAEV